MTDLLEKIAESNIINFIIVLALLIWLFSKINLKAKTAELSLQIKNYVKESETEKESSLEKLKEIKTEIVNLPENIKDIELSTEKNLQGINKRISKEIEEKKSDLQNNEKRILRLERKKFKEKLTTILTETSIDLAKKNAIEQLENNRELHDKYIYEAINEIDGVNL